MSATVTLKGSVTLDETAGFQTSGVPVIGFEDDNDNEVDPASLPSEFSTELATPLWRHSDLRRCCRKRG